MSRALMDPKTDDGRQMVLSNTRGIEISAGFGAAKVTTEFRTFDFKEPYEGVHWCDDRAFVDFSLTPRPVGSHGQFDGRWPSSRSEPIGAIFFVPAGVALRGSCEPGWARSLSCFIDADLLSLDAEQLDDGALSESLHVENPRIRAGLNRILHEVTFPSLVTPLAVEAAGILLGVDMARHLQRRRPSTYKTGGLSDVQRKNLEARLRSDLPSPSIDELAAECGVSPRHLSRAFQRETGRTIGEYVRAAGIERAWRMLTKTEAPIKQIAAELGFTNGAAFSFAFLRATGQRPREVRRVRRA